MNLIAATPPRRLDRRQLLRLAALGAAGFSLPGSLPAQGAIQAREASGRAKHCIFIFLCGGPSQPDLWDLKPDAPDGIRSVFRPVRTNIPGIHFSELLPRLAAHADKLALIRSMTHDNNDHNGGIVHTLLGKRPDAPRQFYASRQDHPGLGSLLHRLHGGAGELPPWVILPRPFTTSSPPYKGQSAGFLGPAYDPVVLDKPKKSSLAVSEIRLRATDLPGDVGASRLAARRRLLEAVDHGEGRRVTPVATSGLQQQYEKAFALLSSGAVQQAFDLDREPDRLRDRYGRNEYGQSFLLARRLVEAGVRVVNVFWTFFDEKGCQFNLWDNHGVATDVCGVGGARTGIDMLKHAYCCPSFDLAFSALLEDLQARGLLAETLVAVAGEFGRTPRINATAGRDHWAPCYTQLLAGGGVRGGQVYGASDRTGAYVKDRPVRPEDFTATLLHAFGVSPGSLVYDRLNRPHHVSEGVPLTALF